MAAGAAAAAAAAARTLRDVACLDLLAVPPQQLPEAIRETEAEWRRACLLRHRWQRVFPDAQQPERHQDLFETPRLTNALVQRYLMMQQRAG